jgi:hypothetical protein
MKNLVAVAVLVFAVAFIVALANPKPKTAAASASPVDTALVGCERYVRARGKLAVAEITDRYEITGKKLEPGHVLVGLEYRTQGAGVLMRARCEYAQAGNDFVLVDAKAGVAR